MDNIRSLFIQISQPESVMYRIVADITGSSNWWWQLVGIFSCGLLSLMVSYIVYRQQLRHPKTSESEGTEIPDNILAHWILRLLVPGIFAFLLLCIEGVLIQANFPYYITHLLMLLLGSWTLIQLIVLGMRRAFPRIRLSGSEKTISVSIWLLLVLHVFGLLKIIQDHMRQLSLPLGSTPITLLDLTYAVVLTFTMLLLALWFGAYIDRKMEKMRRLDFSLRVVLSRIVRTLSIIVAVLFSMSALGIDLTVLSVFGGALGVGLGLGLQRIASNYVSGFIVLFERSVKIGDIVTLSGQAPGWITAIRTRYSVVRTFDGNEVMVPNELLVSTALIRQNLEVSEALQEALQKKVRIILPMVITFESSVEQALAILENAPLAFDRVLQDPPPVATLTQLTSDGYALELAFSAEEPQKSTAILKSDILRSILSAFKQQDIRLASKQQRIFFDSAFVPSAGS